MPVETTKGARAVRTIVFTGISVLAAAWFYFYYHGLAESRRQTALNSAVASLEVTSDVLGSKLSSWANVVRNEAVSAHNEAILAAKTAAKTPTPDSLSFYNEYIEHIVPELDPTECDPTSKSKLFEDPAPKSNPLEDQAKLLEKVKASDKAAGDRASGEDQLKLYLKPGQQHTLQFKFVTSIDGKNGCATSKQNLLPSIFNKLPDDMFEDVLLASSNGKVYYQFAGIGPRISSLEGLLAGATNQAPANNFLTTWLTGLFGNKQEKPPVSTETVIESLREAGEYASRKATQDASRFSNLLKVELGGEEYFLILQPVSIVDALILSPIKPNGPPDPADPKGAVNLVLVGLIRSHRLDAETSAWPRNVVAWAALLLVLLYSLIYTLSCVSMKARLQPVHRLNVAGIAFCALSSCAALTLIVMHGWFVLFEAHKDTKNELMTLAQGLDKNFQEELCHLYQILGGMTSSGELKVALGDFLQGGEANEDNFRIVRNLLDPLYPGHAMPAKEMTRVSAIAYSYPFFDQVAWATAKTGTQIAKWSIHRDVTPETNLMQFSWFFDAREEGRQFRLRASPGSATDQHGREERLLLNAEAQEVYVEPLVSPNTGEYLTVLMKRYQPPSSEEYVGYVIAPLMSVNSPVFPPGYGFAIIRASGTVLYSSNPDRNKLENLFRECAWNERLMLATHARTPDPRPLPVTYSGREVLMYVHPMEALDGANWTIVTYRELAEDQGADADTLTQTMGLMFVHGLILLGLVAFFTFVVPRHWAQKLWPDRTRARDYQRLVFVLLLVSLFTWLIAFAGSRTLVFVEVLALPPLAVVLATAFLLNWQPVTFLIACIYPWIGLFDVNRRASEGLFEWQVDAEILMLGLGIFAMCVTPFGFGEHAPQMRWLQRLRSSLKSLQPKLARLIPKTVKRFLVVAHSRVRALVSLSYQVAARIGSMLLSSFPNAPRGGSERPLAFVLYKVAVCLGVMLLSVLPTIAYYRVSFQIVHAARAMQDLVKVNQSLERRARDVKHYYYDINLADLPHDINLADSEYEENRVVTDRLARENDRYDLSLAKHQHGRVEFPDHKSIPESLDAGMSAIPFLHITSTADFLPHHSSVFRDQFFLLCHWPSVQFSYHDQPADGAVTPGLSHVGVWDYRRVAQIIPDLGGPTFAIRSFTLMLLVLAFLGTSWLVNLLFFLKFKAPDRIKGMNLRDAERLETNILLLSIAGSLDGVNLCETRGIKYFDCRQLDGLWDAFRSLSLWNRPSAEDEPVVLGNFDLCSDSEETAGTKLLLLEHLLFSAHRRVVVIAAVDPVEYIAEVISDFSGRPAAIADFFSKTEQRWSRAFLCFEHRLQQFDVRKTIDPEEGQRLARRIYASCTDSQRAVLYQIGGSGWVNPKNSRAISSLIARGWVELDPMPLPAGELKLIGGSLSGLAGPEEIRRWGTRTGPPLLTIVAIILAAGLLIAGKDIFQSIPGMITGLLAILPGVWKTFSQLSAKSAATTSTDTANV